MVLDLNQNGLALQAPEPLSPVQQVPLRFVLPGTENMVEGTGEVIWADDGGRAGMLFSRLTPASRKYLKQWFGKRTAGKKKPVAKKNDQNGEEADGSESAQARSKNLVG